MVNFFEWWWLLNNKGSTQTPRDEGCLQNNAGQATGSLGGRLSRMAVEFLSVPSLASKDSDQVQTKAQRIHGHDTPRKSRWISRIESAADHYLFVSTGLRRQHLCRINDGLDVARSNWKDDLPLKVTFALIASQSAGGCPRKKKRPYGFTPNYSRSRRVCRQRGTVVRSSSTVFVRRWYSLFVAPGRRRLLLPETYLWIKRYNW
jgi:hypothetical protein